MRIFNEAKTQELLEYDLEKGYLKQDVLITHINEQREVKEKSHYEVIREYPNGGKDVKKVIDVEYKPYIAEHDETEDILIYILHTQEELNTIELNKLRQQREVECFPIINRGQLWYDTLTSEQRTELQEWYHAWLDVTETKVIPTKPSWLK